MNEKIFRQKSIDRVNSPEDLNDYVRVASPGVWLILAAIIVLLIGACIWGILGHIETAITAEALADKGTVTIVLAAEDLQKTSEGMTVRIGETEGVITTVGTDSVTVDASLPDGGYTAEIIIESVQPLSFVFN